MTTSYTFREAGNLLGISRQAVYSLVKNHLHELGQFVRKEKGRKILTADGIEALRSLSRCQDNCQANCQTNCQEGVKPVDSLTDNRESLDWYRKEFSKKDNLIQKLIDNQAEDKKRADTIIMTLSNQVKQLTTQLQEQDHSQTEESDPIQEQPETPEKPAHVVTIGDVMKQRDQELRNQATQKIHPPPDSCEDFEKPAEKITGLKRLFFEFFNPVSLRGRV